MIRMDDQFLPGRVDQDVHVFHGNGAEEGFVVTGQDDGVHIASAVLETDLDGTGHFIFNDMTIGHLAPSFFDDGQLQLFPDIFIDTHIHAARVDQHVDMHAFYFFFAHKMAAGHSQISPIDQFDVCIYQSHKNPLAVYKII